MAETRGEGVAAMDSLEYKIFSAARDNMPLTLYALLWEKGESSAHLNNLLNHQTEEDSQKTTPLIIASKNGHHKVVQMLLNSYKNKMDIEVTGTVTFDGFVIEGATPLWCASGGGHFSVIKLLLDHGANVNQPTVTNSTPLRAACFDGRLDIVKYLVSRGADIHMANMYQNTCLMIACYKGHRPVVKYLLESGAAPNTKAHCGATALHFASEMGFLQIVKDLMMFHATFQANDQGLTPIHIAAEANKEEVVEYFISYCIKGVDTRERRIDALELLGASFANDKDHYDPEKCYRYLWLAMHERYSEPDNILLKKVLPPIKAYLDHVECQTIDELEDIHGDRTALHMEALVLRERILGEDSSEIPHPVVFRGAVFADGGQFDRCTALWFRAMCLNQKNSRSIAKDLIRFAQVFSQMVRAGAELDFDLILQVLTQMVSELRQTIEKQSSSSTNDEPIMEMEDNRYSGKSILELNIHTALYLLFIIHQMKRSPDEDFQLSCLVYKLNKMNLRLRDNGYSMLHMICDEDTIVDNFHVNDVVRFPCHSLLKLVIRCGADINVVDKDRNTPLHTIVRYNRPISDFLTLHDIIVTLLGAGCHGDLVNNEGKTPSEYSTTGVSEIILRAQWKFSLKCLAARKVKRCSVEYKSLVPTTLQQFIDTH